MNGKEALTALETIRTFARQDTDRPQDVLQTVEVMLASLRDAFTGKTTADVLAAELAALIDVHGRDVADRILPPPTPINGHFDSDDD